MGHTANLKLFKRSTRRAMQAAFAKNVELVKKELKPKPWWLPLFLWRAIGRAVYFNFDL